MDDNKMVSLGLHDELQEVQAFMISYYLLFWKSKNIFEALTNAEEVV